SGLSSDQAKPKTLFLYLTFSSLRVRFPTSSRYCHRWRTRSMGLGRFDTSMAGERSAWLGRNDEDGAASGMVSTTDNLGFVEQGRARIPGVPARPAVQPVRRSSSRRRMAASTCASY